MNTTFTNSVLNLLHDPLSHIGLVLLMVVQIINFTLCIPLNVYVIFVLSRAGGLDESLIFTLSQCVSEILYALSAPVYSLCVVDSNLCFIKALGFFPGIFITARPFFQCCVSLEHYLAVVHPVTFLKLKTPGPRLVCLIVIWTFVLFCSFAAMLTFPLLPTEFFGSLYLAILVVDLFCCASILKVLRQPGPGESAKGREKDGKKNPKKKAFEVVLSIYWHI